MAEDLVHKEQQAIMRQLATFESDLWPAFKKRGFASMGDAFTAYLLMQLVSAAAETALDPPLVMRVAKPESEKEALARAVLRSPTVGGVPVGR